MFVALSLGLINKHLPAGGGPPPPPPSGNSMDFSNADNSMYIVLISFF